jgi:hypothetical protein
MKSVNVAGVIAAIAVGMILSAMTTSYVFAKGEAFAPGQSQPNSNPSSGALPPGQFPFGNPGQCQKILDDFNPPDVAHDACHSNS